MNIAFNEVAMAVLKRPLQDCSLNELQQLVNQYPYFGPAHLLLAKKLQEENVVSYEEQVQKTSLYFQNRLWLHYLLNGSDTAEIIIEHKQATATIVNEREEPLKTEPLLTSLQESEVIVENENRENEIMEKPSDSIETVSMNSEPVAESMAQVYEKPEVVNEEENKDTAPPLEMPQFKIEPIAPGTEFSFEPYHTVDYFASQGIKFKEDERPKDLFSQQLKSFTEWLKTMKRIPANEIAGTMDATNERKIEQLAEHSVVERHIITEAMAEVWEKQGNTTRAEDIYRKLSLLDPSKSSYFAAKIEALKKTS